MGRTGTFITIDHVLEQVGKEGVVDIAGVINKIREQRMKLVQTVVSVAEDSIRMINLFLTVSYIFTIVLL